MEANALFEIALGLGTHWKVVESRLEGEPKRLELKLEPVKGLHWKCPECDQYGPMHDSVERRWRHLNFFQYQSELVTKVPRCRCEKHGVRQVEVPWARAGSGFTLMFEALVMLLCQQAAPKLGRALGLRESLQDVLATRNEAGLKWWCGWAARSRLEPFRKLARTLKTHGDGILGYFESGITSAAIEAINGKLQLAKRIARGFRNFEFFRAIAYLKPSRLNLSLPSLKPS